MLRKILINHGIILSFYGRFELSTYEFEELIKTKVDIEGKDLFGALEDTDKQFRGSVANGTFKLKEKGFWSERYYSARAVGRYYIKDDVIIVQGDVTNLGLRVKALLLMLTLFFGLFFFGSILGDIKGETSRLTLLSITLFHSSLVFFIIYRAMKYSVKKFKINLMQTFNFIFEN